MAFADWFNIHKNDEVLVFPHQLRSNFSRAKFTKNTVFHD